MGIKIQPKHSRFVWPLPHIAPAVIFCETFPAYCFPKRVLCPSTREENKIVESDVFQAIPKNYMETNV